MRLTAKNATAAAAILGDLKRMNGGKHEPLVRGSDVFDASVLCGVAYSQALPIGPSPILSSAAMASLKEVKPEPIEESSVPAPAAEEEEPQPEEENQATTTTITPPAVVVEEIDEEDEKAVEEGEDVRWGEEGETQAAPDEEASGSTSGGAIGGAVVGVLLAVGVAAAGVVYVKRRRRAADQFMVT